ncbi:MAG TPA: hypothetical protein VGZ47_19430 [Gemmataceae bacterium]|nr:hypothetical protein [Gemmataceae bacterium]
MKRQAATPKTTERKKQRFPPGWDRKRVQDVIAYYDRQTDGEGLAEYEAAMKLHDLTMMLVPKKLVPDIRRLIGRRGA